MTKYDHHSTIHSFNQQRVTECLHNVSSTMLCANNHEQNRYCLMVLTISAMIGALINIINVNLKAAI